MKKQVLILGAGVSGLSTGILFLQAGYTVTIWAKDFPPYTTSNKAAAVWYPFICGPIEKVPTWARNTLDYFQSEILPNHESGCKKTTVVEVFNFVPNDPWWKDGVDSYRRIDKYKLPKHYIDGYQIEGLVMDTDVYMDYLVSEYKRLGGKMIKKTLTDIKEPLQTHKLVINCTGLGSRELCNDQTIYPCRGQIIRIKPNGFDYSLFEEEGPNSLAYIIPRLKDIVIGGTAQDNDWNLEIDPKDTKEILEKCAAILPQFKKVDILDIKVGLRPARKEIRLEPEKFGSKTIIHNYGHGGGGFTLSWGCAQNVLEIAEKITL